MEEYLNLRFYCDLKTQFLIFVSAKTHMKIKTRASPTLIPDKIIGSTPPILPNENGPIINTINPPPINIKIHMVKIKL